MPENKIVQDLRELVKKYGSQKAVAEKLHVSPQYLNDVLKGKRQPGPAFTDALGYERIVKYKEIKP